VSGFVPARAFGTELRALLDRLDGDVASALADLGLDGYRPRFSPVVRVLVEEPASVRQIADATGVTHSAASQTVAAMARAGWVAQRVGTDARERVVELTPRAREALPRIRAEWAVTAAALADLEAELPYPITALVTDLRAALDRTSFRERMALAARTDDVSADVAAHRKALGDA
jgi:DNA-binding MarR family transcriptional regulator